MRAGYAVFVASFAPIVLSQFHICDAIIGHDFFDAFKWETLDDPTHGRVNYVDQVTAINANYSFASDHKFVMRPNDVDIVSPGARGRDSVRITSWKSYDDSVIVLDLEHMPEGCGTWPAFWTLSKAGPWPHGGEVDIVEGVNKNTHNLATLHTSPGCSMPHDRSQSGSTVSTNCDVSVNYNQGCGTSFDSPSSYGSGFNANGGGWFVMQKSSPHGISIWFWSRNDPSVPNDIRDGAEKLYPNAEWGMPDADFPCDHCDYHSHFDAHQMIFDLTFCGDWAGSVYPDSGCGGSCIDFVDNNPEAFLNAYWEINSLRVYTP